MYAQLTTTTTHVILSCIMAATYTEMYAQLTTTTTHVYLSFLQYLYGDVSETNSKSGRECYT